MLIKSKYLIFFPSLIMGTLMVVSSSSWFTAWMGLEINLMSMIPIIINKLNFMSVEASMKYFLVQAISSSILIFSVFLSHPHESWGFLSNLDNIYFFCFSLKAGVAPLHFWFPQVILCTDWVQNMILLTWQKIAPFIMMSYLKSQLTMMFIIACALIGTMGGINQINVKLILAYSSIINSAWLLALTSLNEFSWWVYFLSYIFMTLSASYIFMKFNITKLNSLYKMNMPLTSKTMFLVNFLSLAGLPPFLGFFVKITAINLLMESEMNTVTIFILVMTSILSFYFYLRSTYSALFTNETFLCMKLFYESKNNLKTIFVMSLTSTLGVFAIPLLIY